jgi:hypothetical protein
MLGTRWVPFLYSQFKPRNTLEARNPKPDMPTTTTTHHTAFFRLLNDDYTMVNTSADFDDPKVRTSGPGLIRTIYSTVSCSGLT